MTRVLITGATGNVGREVINSLDKFKNSLDIYAGVRNIEKDRKCLENFHIKYTLFDFTDISSYKPALDTCDILFLLRPPQISKVDKYFKPLVAMASRCNIKHIIFLSVQGVEKSKLIPHYKIEKLIAESGIKHTFLRPAYFMQNFTTTLKNDLTRNKRIFLPAENAKFTLIDVADIGEVTAKILTEPEKHTNQSYELTNNEKLTFGEMAVKLSKGLNTTIVYKSPNLLTFYLTKRREKIPAMFILVMIMLHYFPRFQKEPETTDWVERITGKQPVSFDQFIMENKNSLC